MQSSSERYGPEVARKATLELQCPKCGVQWVIPLKTDVLTLEQELVTVRIDEEKRIEDIINNVYDDEPGAVKEWHIKLTATADDTLWGMTCACLGRN